MLRKGSRKQRRGTRGSANQNNDVVDDVDSLFETIRQDRCVLQSVVDEWIEHYRQDRENYIIHLMQFFIRSSGCEGRITTQMRQAHNNDNAQIIRALVDELTT